MCGEEGHVGDSCRWVYSTCNKPRCDGIRLIRKSQTSDNPGRKFLSCQFCSSFQWLDQAITQAWTVKGVGQTSNGCFKCGEIGHWQNACPWVNSKCNKQGCTGKRKLLTSGTESSLGNKFLKCGVCQSFQWLKHAIEDAKKSSESVCDPVVTIQVPLSQLCKSLTKCNVSE
ncbi:hypothetical protein FRX31_017630 [Thalictrum thalictroides]|uniref:CCHC-type domain-containing protein n=1 Tax=Thalictrum thalictroides TaxID=46969 RepID=A0A7J6W897_THATH|nr:hypothetical protein FRX31_017630 [Thalictrum thalictroides]